MYGLWVVGTLLEALETQGGEKQPGGSESTSRWMSVAQELLAAMHHKVDRGDEARRNSFIAAAQGIKQHACMLSF